MYHIITKNDCLSVATDTEKNRLSIIFDYHLMNTLARRWCIANDYKLGGYLGNNKWDATSPHPK